MKKSLDQSNDKIINNVKNEIKVIEVKKNYKNIKNKTEKNRSINIVRTKALSHRVGNLQKVQNKIENIKNIEEIGEKKNICCSFCKVIYDKTCGETLSYSNINKYNEDDIPKIQYITLNKLNKRKFIDYIQDYLNIDIYFKEAFFCGYIYSKYESTIEGFISFLKENKTYLHNALNNLLLEIIAFIIYSIIRILIVKNEYTCINLKLDLNNTNNCTINSTINNTINSTINNTINSAINNTINSAINNTINSTINNTINSAINNIKYWIDEDDDFNKYQVVKGKIKLVNYLRFSYYFLYYINYYLYKLVFLCSYKNYLRKLQKPKIIIIYIIIKYSLLVTILVLDFFDNSKCFEIKGNLYYKIKTLDNLNFVYSFVDIIFNLFT